MTIWQNKSFSDPFKGTDKKAKIERLKPSQSPELIIENNQEIKENRNMNKKQVIKINENQLKQIVNESVKMVLNEDWTTYGQNNAKKMHNEISQSIYASLKKKYRDLVDGEPDNIIVNVPGSFDGEYITIQIGFGCYK